MGCNLSPVIAEALVSYIFDLGIKSFNNKPKFVRFFVDDSFIIINKRYIASFFHHMNNLDQNLKSIKFTMEQENNDEISFLDVKISRYNNVIQTCVYRKPTHSNRYLNFNSNHSLENKKAVIRTLANIALTNTSDRNQLDAEFNSIVSMLRANNYPLNIITQIINQCKIKFYSREKHNHDTFDITKTITIPYYRNVSENIKTILRKYDISVVYKRGNSINNLLNPIKKSSLIRSNVVYNLNCMDCNSTYIGTTKRKLGIRIDEHAKSTQTKSNVAKHAIDHGHRIDYDNPKITYFERNNSARVFLEGFDIMKNKLAKNNLMNDKINMQNNIPPIYLPLTKYCK